MILTARRIACYNSIRKDKKEMEKQSKIVLQIAGAYILLPFLIFVLGWIKMYIAVPLVFSLLFCFWKVCTDMPKLWIPEINKENIIRIIFIVGVISVWIYYSGIGKFVFQNTDHTARNTIFNILVEYEWPVVTDIILPKNNGVFNTTGLIYYIGFWLPSALIGKLLGMRAGYYAQAVWALLGILIVYYLICTSFRKIKIWPLFVLVFFSGLDIIGVFFTSMDFINIESKWHIEWWSNPYQYSSMTTQLFWVFNQAIPAWLCTMLAYVQKNNRNLVFILACSMLSSTFPFIGLLFIILFLCFSREYTDEKKISSPKIRTKLKNHIACLLRDTCTIQNVLGGGIIGITSFLYLNTNLSGSRFMAENTKGPQFESSLAKLVIFLILEIGIYSVLLYKYHQNNKLYYFIVVCLGIIPLIRVGYSNDFCMRASIPALFILMVWVIETIYESWNKKEYGIFVGVIIAVLIGSVTPICEFKRTFTETFERLNVGQTVYAEDDDEIEILNSYNFMGDIDNSFFFKYLAK